MPGCGVDGGRIRIEQALGVRSVELADIDATGLGAAAATKKRKCRPIREELRRRMTPALRRLESRDGGGFADRLAETRRIGPPGFVDKDCAIAVPRGPRAAPAAGDAVSTAIRRRCPCASAWHPQRTRWTGCRATRTAMCPFGPGSGRADEESSDRSHN